MNSMKNILPNLILRQNALYWTHIFWCIVFLFPLLNHPTFGSDAHIWKILNYFNWRKKGEYATSTSKFQPLISREFDQTHIILMCHQHFLDILRKFQMNSSNLLDTCICSAVYTNRGGMRRSGANHTSNIYNV